MAAYRRVYDSCHLQADCQEPRSAPEPYARQLSMGSLYLFSVMMLSVLLVLCIAVWPSCLHTCCAGVCATSTTVTASTCSTCACEACPGDSRPLHSPAGATVSAVRLPPDAHAASDAVSTGGGARRSRAAAIRTDISADADGCRRCHGTACASCRSRCLHCLVTASSHRLSPRRVARRRRHPHCRRTHHSARRRS